MVAAAPPLFAATLAHLGPVGAAALTVALALVSLAAMLALALSHRREGAT
jgi:Na+-driven multidrug efflux pump